MIRNWKARRGDYDEEALIFDDLWGPDQPLDGEELWTSVVGYEGTYEVSTHGRVRRIAPGRGAVPGHILSQHPIWKAGHLGVSLCLNAIQKTFPVHKLVALAFIGPPPEDEFGEFQIHHIDTNCLNNSADNLEWVTSKENKEESWARYMAGEEEKW